MSKTLNVPNQITLSRLGLAILFVALLAQYSQRNPQPLLLDIANALFIIAAITDILDGYLARKWGMETSLGRVLDPFVDKVLVCGTFVFLAGASFRDAQGHQTTELQPWMALAPGIALSLAVLAFNLLGDTLRDVLDPRMRGGR